MSQQLSSISESRPGRILIVDDEAFIREAIELYLATEGFEVLAAGGGQQALEMLSHNSVNLAILDIMMPGMDGIELLRQLKKSYPDLEVVMASGCGTLETAVEAMRLGAYDYITKPILNFDEDLLKVVKKALERGRLLATNRRLTQDLREINRELKHANATLKRNVADLEILYETGRLLGDLDSLAPLLDVVEATLIHQLDVSRALIALEDPNGWRVCRTPGVLEPPVSPPLLAYAPTFLADPRAPFEVLELTVDDDQDLAKFLGDSGIASDASERVWIVPLRAGGELIGLLFALSEASAALAEDHVRLLKLFAGQISGPLALHLDGVSS